MMPFTRSETVGDSAGDVEREVRSSYGDILNARLLWTF